MELYEAPIAIAEKRMTEEGSGLGFEHGDDQD
jgi:hypothetical protein